MLTLALLLPLVAALQDDDPGFRAPTVIEGRFVTHDGAPLAGVEVALHGELMPGRLVRDQAPGDWRDLSVTSDADGRFRLQFVPPRAYAFRLDASAPDVARAWWDWEELELDQRLVLGDVCLPRLGILSGALLDDDGLPQTQGWAAVVRLLRFAPLPAGGRFETRYYAGPDPETGEFRIRVPAGTFQVTPFERVASLPAVVLPGMETRLELTVEPLDPSRMIEVLVSVEGDVHTETRLRGPDGFEVVRNAQGRSFSEVFEDLPPGEYEVEIRGEEVETWTAKRARPGSSLTAYVRGNARLELVFGQEVGRPVRGVGVYRPVHDWHYGSGLYSDLQPLPWGRWKDSDTYVIEHLLPGRHTLLLVVDDWPPQFVEVELAPGERHSLPVELQRSASVRGRVFDERGAPLAGVPVHWTLSDGRQGRMTSSSVIRGLEGSTATDASGRFEITGLAEGEVHLRVFWGLDREVERVVRATREVAPELQFPAPPAGWLELTLQVPGSVEANELEVSLEQDARRGWFSHGLRSAHAAEPLRLGPIAAGRYTAEVNSPVVLESGTVVSRTGALAGIVIEPGRTTRATLDLRRDFPGWARLRFEEDITRREVRVELHSLATGTIRAPLRGEDTDWIFEDLAPGEWTIVVRASNRSWSWTSPAPLTVEPGAEAVRDVHLDVTRRTARFVRAETGKRYARRLVVSWAGPEFDSTTYDRFKTDDDGCASFLIPEGGALRFCRWANDDEAVREPDVYAATVRWETDEVVVVRLP